jgi:Flp pilus assembly protein TadG
MLLNSLQRCASKISKICRRRSSGQVAVLVALSMVSVLGCVSLAVDVGLLWSERRQMQSAADAAAIAAAVALRNDLSVSSAADESSTLNGFTNGQNNVTVTANNPPQSGAYSGNSNYVEIIISQTVPTYFMAAIGYSTVPITTRAVAGSVAGPGCVYALDPSASSAISASNGVSITSYCGVLDDSNSSSALDVVGGAVIKTTGAGVVGQAELNNNGQIENLSGSAISATQDISPVPDPLSYIAAPTVGGCTYTGTQNLNSYTASQSPAYSGNYVVSPGTYCGGISASNGTSVTFNPGTYIIAGGGLSLQNGGGKVTGTGVTFYITTGAAAGYSGSNNAYAGVNIANGVTVSLSAPTTGGVGSLEGILFFQDRSVPTTGAASYFAGGANMTLTGALYFPTTQLNYSNGISAAYTILVADTLVFTGGATMNNNYSSLADGSPIKSSALAE